MAVKEQSLANLKPVGPGNNLNPNGRPKGVKNKKRLLATILHMARPMKHPLTGKVVTMSYAEMMHVKQVQKALKGDTNAYKVIMERYEGRPMLLGEMMSMEEIRSRPVESAVQGETGGNVTTIMRRVVFRTRETTSTPQVVNE